MYRMDNANCQESFAEARSVFSFESALLVEETHAPITHTNFPDALVSR